MITLPLFVALLIYGCNDTDDNILDIPQCLVPIVEHFSSTQEDCEGAKVVAYSLHEEEVFALEEGACMMDPSTSIYTQECELICTLNAAAGSVDCQGVDFFAEAIQVRIIWEAK